MKHTPGPWSYSEYQSTILGAREGATHVIVARMPEEIKIHHKANDIKRTNAKLIAAAPDMIRALKAIAEKGCIDLYGFPGAHNLIDAREVSEMVREAIKKATSE